MKNKKQLNSNLNYPLIGIVVFSLVVVVYILMQLNTRQNNLYSTPSSYNPTRPQTKLYRSEPMKFSITVPSSLQIEDAGHTLTLSDTSGKISIIRNGTNYDNLSDYIANFDARRNLTSSEIKKIPIDGKEAVSRIVKFTEENVKQKSYYIYVDNWVYILSTSFEVLFSDLDQIAQSFRYTP